MNMKIRVTADADELFPQEFENDKKHYLISNVDSNGNIRLTFSSLLSIYQFALSLIQEAVYGQNSEKCFQPLIEDDGYLCIIDGVRMGKHSGTIFVFYDGIPEPELPNEISIEDNFDSILLKLKEFDANTEFLMIDSDFYKNYTYLTFSSRKVMYIFGLALLFEAIKKNKKVIEREFLIPIKGKDIRIQWLD